MGNIIPDDADVYIQTGAVMDLNFLGTDTIDRLFFDGIPQPTGTYGRIGSGAEHVSSCFTGNGLLSVTTTVEIQPLDIGLRVFDGTNIVGIACEPPGAGGQLTSPLRIHKNGTNYGVLLVVPDAAEASMLKIQTTDGIKALRKLE